MSDSQPSYGKVYSKKKPTYGKVYSKKKPTSADDSAAQVNYYDFQSDQFKRKIDKLLTLGFDVRGCSKSDIHWYYFKIKTLALKGIDVSALDFEQVEEAFQDLRKTNSQRQY